MDKTLTKYFWIIIVTTLASSAFFTASGTNELIAQTVVGALPAAEVSVDKPASRKRSTAVRVPNGRMILERNIFNSEGSDVADDEGEADDVSDVAPGDKELVQCQMSGVKLLASVASARNPSWSFANVEIGGQRDLFRVGDEIENRTISEITWRHILLSGGSDVCYIDMFGEQNSSKKAPRGAKKKADKKGGGDDRIKVESQYERSVERSIVDEALANPTKFAKDVRVRPYKKNGEVVGFRLRRVRNGSAISQLGAERGDVLHSVNGIELKSIDDAMQAYQKLRADDSLTFSVTRRGKPVELKINIE